MTERLEDILKFRKEKAMRLAEEGVNPYPSVTKRTHTNQEALEGFDSLQGHEISLVGRIRSVREMGKVCFVHIEDGTTRIQVLLKSDNVGEKLKWFLKNFDIGDFFQASGKLFLTKTSEKTLEVSEFTMLAKSIRPLPSDYYGLADEETRLRKRYLDLLQNPDSREIFVKKAKFWNSMRDFLQNEGFMHIEMPVLESTPGGAEARPFITHHNALGRDFYLRISLELPLKKMLVGGYEKVFEIGRIFRNEGISTEHLQDYTQMEFYWAYCDFEGLMRMIEKMYQYVIQETFGTLSITARGMTVDWSGSWERVSYVKIFQEHTGLNLLTCSDEDLKDYCTTNHIPFESFAERGRLMDIIFKKIRKTLPGDRPVFLVDQPLELEPLAKRDPNNPKIVQRMQIIAYGTELGKGFGELNDPLDQRSRFDAQMKLREKGDEEAQMIDEDYLEAMEYGMPPCAGFGLSERLFAFLADKSIRETVVFPLMQEKQKSAKDVKVTPMAVAVVNKGASLLPWQEMNTIAHLSAAFAAREGKHLFYEDTAMSKDGQSINMNISHAIIIKAAESAESLRSLVAAAKKAGLQVSEFTQDMIESSDDKKVIAAMKAKKHSEIEFYGVLVFGNKKQVESLTKDFQLYT
ncbi:MAG TPA: lysine--tRNA ligase [Patescibacteria group bacterium]|nr:lysine--tRNA ligase [Patescibacteria group bacterium]